MRGSSLGIILICAIYLVLAGRFAMTPLDIDEFTFIREPYELLGGDYTVGYLKGGEYAHALETAIKSYYFFWKYRPLNAPIIAETDQSLFNNEEGRFGYVKPVPNQSAAVPAVDSYLNRLIVPEPDRFYSHGAGKPLLSAILSIPQLAVLNLTGIGKAELLDVQSNNKTSVVLLLSRFAQYIAGAISIIILYLLTKRTFGSRKACIAALIFAIFPLTIKYFPNLHHDSIMVPFILLTIYFATMNRFVAAGVAYGLALASKNVAIIVMPALIIQIAMQSFLLLKDAGRSPAVAYLRSQILGLLIIAGIAVCTLIPFANPVSYAEEILTPVITRPIDTRGENVAKWTFKEMANPERSSVSPSVIFVQKLLYFHDIGFFFMILASFAIIPDLTKRSSQISMIMLILYIPFSAIFSTLLDYRTLILVPLFIIVASEVLDARRLGWLAMLTMALTFAYTWDPTKTDLIHQHPLTIGTVDAN